MMAAAAADNYTTHTHTNTPRYTLINTHVTLNTLITHTHVTLKFSHLLLHTHTHTHTQTHTPLSISSSMNPAVSLTLKHCPLSAAGSSACCVRCGLLPAGVRPGLQAPLGVGLPHAVGELVADGRHDLDELQGPLVQVQGADPGQVGPQVPVDPRALDADQGSEVQTRPVGAWRRTRDRMKHGDHGFFFF